jgi:diguanylate cyclase (GGDEF)-like protein
MIDPERVLKSPEVPTLPNVAVRLMDMSSDPEAGIRDIVAVIRTDPGISARIIKSVNSPYFGLNAEVSSVESAVPLLGSSVVVSLALSFSLVQEDEATTHKEHYKALWSQALLKAVMAEYLARKFGYGAPSDYFLAGLLCDVGILAMLNTIPTEYSEVIAAARDDNRQLTAIEKEQLGFDHTDIGVRLTADWCMPAMVVDAIRFHHASVDTIREQECRPHYTLIKATRFASCATDYLTRGSKDDVRAELRELGNAFFDLDDADLDKLLAESRDRTDEAAAIMSIDTDNLPRPTELLARANAKLVNIALQKQAALTQLSAENDHLQQKSVRDALTGLHNRLAFDENYERMLRECLERGEPAGVIFCDIDKFKSLNDTYGHQFGDEVLARVATLLSLAMRATDFIARYGGEEFVIVALNCDVYFLESIAERLRTNVETEVIAFKGNRVPVTISVGGCAADRYFDDEMAQRMLREADAAMYECKRNGRNKVRVGTYSGGETQHSREALLGTTGSV